MKAPSSRPFSKNSRIRLIVALVAIAIASSLLSATASMQGQADKSRIERVDGEKRKTPLEPSQIKQPLVGLEAAQLYAQLDSDGQPLTASAAAAMASQRVFVAAPHRANPLAPASAITCNGAGGLWSAAGSWTGGVPTAADSVTITNGCTITIDTFASALTLNVQSGGLLQFDNATGTLIMGQSVTIDSGGIFQTDPAGTVATHTLSVGTDLINNGTLDFSTNANAAGASITFTGAGSNSFSGTGATTDIRTLTINKGTSPVNVLEITTSNLTVQGTTTDGAPMAFLTLTNGTLKISGSFTMTARVFTSAGYTIPASGGIWLNNPNFTVAGQGSSATNNGLLRLTNGVYNIGSATGNSMNAGIASAFTVEGGTMNVTGALTGVAASTFVTYTQSGGTVNVRTIAGGASSVPSFGFLGSTGNLMNISGGVINLVQASTAATPVDYNQVGTMFFTGGTLNVGTAATATNFLFRIQGQIPAAVIDNTTNNKSANLSGQGNVWGNLTINTGTILNLNSQALLMIGSAITNNGALSVTTNNTGTVAFGGTQQTVGAPYAQTYNGTGTFGAAALRVGTINVQNQLGLNINGSVSALNIYRLNALFGATTNCNLIAPGAGDAVVMVLQRGVAGNAFPAGTLDAAPAFNIGSGGLTLVYAQSTTVITTGPEIPATRSVLGIQIVNPTGVTISGGALTATNTAAGLLLSSGTLNTTAANLLTLSATTTGAISGGSAATYVNGPLARTLPASLASGSTHTFPVGKGSFRMLELVNPTTNAGGTVVIQTEVFDADSGGTGGAGLSDINHNRYWSSAITAGAGNFTNATVRLTEPANVGIHAIGQSATQGGAYASIGGTVTPPTIGPSSATTSLGFFAVGVVTGAPTISGNFTVGAAGTYLTLTAAVTDLNTKLQTGPVSFTLLDNVYAGETYPITIQPNAGSSATNTLTIKPNTGATPAFSGSTTSALILLNGADYVTIDGSNTVGGTTRNMSLTNTNVGTSSAVIWGQTILTNDPATNNTVKNLNLTGNAPTTTFAGVGFGNSTISTTSIGTRNDNNRVQNNNIVAAQFGIFSSGASATNKNFGTVITGNTIGGAGGSAVGREGIFVGFDDGVQVTNNTVSGVNGAVTSVDAMGIAIGTLNISTAAFGTISEVVNSVITGNNVGSVVKTDTFSAAGIALATTTYGTSRIANNVITGVVGDGTSGDFCVGIFVGNGGVNNSPMQIYYNSVSMTAAGRDTGGATSQPSFALAIFGANPLVDIRNNILYNTQTAGVGGPGGAAGSFAIGLSSVAPFTNITSNNNDLFTSGASSHFAVIGGLTNLLSESATLAAWQAATGKDTNSISANPLFTSVSDLHLQPTCPVLSIGTPIGTVTTDMDSDPRPAANPDMGADEIVQAVGGSFAAGTYYNASAANNDLLAGNVNITNTLNLGGVLNTGANTLTIGCNGSITGASPTSYVNGNLNKSYCGVGVKGFEVGTANGYSPVSVNITAGTFPVDFKVKANQGPQPNFNSPQYALQRYWSLSTPGSVTADLNFNYLDPTDIPGTANENAFVIFKYNGSFSMPGGTVLPGSNQASILGVTSFSDWTLAQANAPSAAPISLSGLVTRNNGTPLGGVTVNLTGSTNGRTITDANGQYQFIVPEGFYTVAPVLANYSFSPASRSFSLLGNKTDAVFVANATTPSENPLNAPDFFVRQQYLDFLGREPDHDGWIFWSNQIAACGVDQNCARLKRLDVSAAFFMSEEFQLSGDYIYRLYRLGLGRQLTYAEFTDDHKKVIGGSELDAMRTRFAEEFTQRPEFVQRYQNAVLAETFVDALLQGVLAATQLDLSSQREALIATYHGGGDQNHSRSAVLVALSDNSAFRTAVYNPSFVLMEYFGYLQRDMDQQGFDFWVNVLNNREPGNYRGMVCSFITSAEYQERFSQVVTRNNGECGR